MPVLTDLLGRLSSPDVTYVDIFSTADEDSIKETYKVLAVQVHPDKGGSTALFQRLSQLRDEAMTQLAAGHYGEPVVISTIRTKKAEHKVKVDLGNGDLAHLYRTLTLTEAGEQTGFLKMALSPRDNDLLGAEARALKKLHATDDQLVRHFPLLLDTFLGEGRRRGNVQGFQTECVNLVNIHDAYPGGLEPVHAVWIWRRLLMAVGYAHSQGVLHGAIVPLHILIYPEQHGVILVDWCYSSIVNDPDTEVYSKIKAVAKTYTDFYPKEVFDKEAPTEALDIFMAAKCMIWLLGGDVITRNMPFSVPQRMRAFLRGCCQPEPTMRPTNAWIVLQEFDDMLKLIGSPFYPRKWVEFTMPAGS
jgi:hypothetical protein